MNYYDLKEIIKHLKKVVSCAVCQKRFNHGNMNLVASMGNDAFFHLHCEKCQNEIIVHVSVMEPEIGNITNEQPQIYNIRTANSSSISKDDILDIHNFLGKFNGDFKNLFSNETT